MLIDIEKLVAAHHQDFLGVLMIINDRFERFPETFGNEATRATLREEIAALKFSTVEPQWWDGKPLMLRNARDYGAQLAEIFDRQHITPLKDVSVALVGCRSAEHDTLKSARRFLPKRNRFEIPRQPGERLDADNALTLTDNRKMDYVVTGNAINDPFQTAQDQVNTMLACGNLLKAGGRAIHMLGYGEYDSKEKPIGYLAHPLVHAGAGQRFLYNLPDGPYQGTRHKDAMHALALDHTHVMVLEQVKEVTRSSADASNLYRQVRADLRASPSGDADPPEPPPGINAVNQPQHLSQVRSPVREK